MASQRKRSVYSTEGKRISDQDFKLGKGTKSKVEKKKEKIIKESRKEIQDAYKKSKKKKKK